MIPKSTLAQDDFLAQNSKITMQLTGIGKSFSGVNVLRDVDLEIRGGEIHTLMGENGAGKSTLVKIISGVQHPSTGTIRINEEEVQFASPAEANEHGIVIMHQELSLIPEMTVAQNVMLGQEPRIGGAIVDNKRLRQTAREALRKFGFSLDIDTLVKDLRVGEQQLVEIARALLMNAKLLIMDEPTSALSQTEADILMEVVRDLVRQGVAIIYISHRMDEVFEISDRVTVLRDGDLIGTTLASSTTPEELIQMMVGRSVEIKPVNRNTPASSETVMSVQGLSAELNGRAILEDVTFDLKRGEVLGIGGLLGAGRTELLETLFGARGGDHKGTVKINGTEVSIDNPVAGISHGLALITEDRKGNGLLLERSISTNVNLPLLRSKSHFGYFGSNAQNAIAEKAIKDLRVAATGYDHLVGRLSGGNQQKVVLGKWLATNPNILLLDEPTRGIDIGAKDEIYDLIGRLADQGISVLFASSEIPEFLAVCDRMIVLCEGRVAGELSRDQMTVDAIKDLSMQF